MKHHNAIINEAELRVLLARDMDRNQIARHFGCSPITVGARIRALRRSAPADTAGRTALSDLPKTSVERAGGFVSLPAISMFIRTREEMKP